MLPASEALWLRTRGFVPKLYYGAPPQNPPLYRWRSHTRHERQRSNSFLSLGRDPEFAMYGKYDEQKITVNTETIAML